MAQLGTRTRRETPRASDGFRAPAAVGLIGATLLIVAAMVVPPATGWDVRIGVAPIFAHWDPRVGPGTLGAVVIGLLGISYAHRWSAGVTWPRLLALSWIGSLGWLSSLALVDGDSGFTRALDVQDFLQVARRTTDVSGLLHSFTGQIAGEPGWPTHVAGHPPGALLFFVTLVRLHLGSSLAVGLVITLVASTIPLAVLCTLRALDAEAVARTTAPFVVLAPAAIWTAVSADAVYATAGAWGLATLALAATKARAGPAIGWAIVSGLLLGLTCLMSYGLPLLAFPAIGVLLAARTGRPVVPCLAAASAVVGAFWLAGFALWDAYPAIHTRYYAGVASERPASYWLWGDLAALCFSAGPALGAAIACWWTSRRSDEPGLRTAWLLGTGAVAAVVLADVSLMSKAEVERIWLPFVPWLLVLTAFLPARWRRAALGVNVVFALLVQHLLLTGW